MPAGRPLLFDDDKKKIFCNLLALDCSRSTAAKGIGISPYTVVRHLNDCPDFLDRVRVAESTALVELITDLRAAIKKSWRAAAWALPRINALVWNQPAGKQKPANTEKGIFEEAQWNVLDCADEVHSDENEYALALAREEQRIRFTRGRGELQYNDPGSSLYQMNSHHLRELEQQAAERATSGPQDSGVRRADEPTEPNEPNELAGQLAGEPYVAEEEVASSAAATNGPPADRLTEAAAPVAATEVETRTVTPWVPIRPSQSPLDQGNYAWPADEQSLEFSMNSALQTSSNST